MSDERALRELTDRQVISDVLTAYCEALDRMDLSAVAALFTPDCVVDYGTTDWLKSEGTVALERDLARLWRFRRTAHLLSNIRIELQGADTATASSYVHAWHERENGETSTILGRYDDQLVRTGDGWRIHRRRMSMLGSDTGFRVPIHPAERKPTPDGWSFDEWA